jgi:hypothetical protein
MSAVVTLGVHLPLYSMVDPDDELKLKSKRRLPSPSSTDGLTVCEIKIPGPADRQVSTGAGGMNSHPHNLQVSWLSVHLLHGAQMWQEQFSTAGKCISPSRHSGHLPPSSGSLIGIMALFP